MNPEAKSVIFHGGLPYGPEIKKLDSALPLSELHEGRVIEHETLERVLGCRRGSTRYYGVVDAWIKKQRNENGLFLVWIPGEGVKVLTPGEILSHAERRTRQKIRQTGRAIKTFVWVDRDRLDETGQQRLDHQMRVASAIKDSLESARKQLAVELAPVVSLPKRQISGAK